VAAAALIHTLDVDFNPGLYCINIIEFNQIHRTAEVLTHMLTDTLRKL
jgi:hypothetical protein